MRSSLFKIFNIRSGEGAKLFLFFILNIGLGLIFVLTNSGVQSIFLKEFGAERLPYVIVCTALFNVFGSIIYVFLVDTVRSDWVYYGIFAALMVILLGVRYSIEAGSLVLYVIAYGLIVTTIKLQDMQLMKYFSLFYDTLQSKRLYPIVSSGARVGTIAGGLGLSLILKRINSSDIPYVCIVITLINIVIVQIIAQRNKRELKLSVSLERRRHRRKGGFAGLENLKQGYQFVSRSALLKATAVASVTLMISLEILRYHYSGIFQDSFATKDQLTAFLGGFAAFANIVAMIIPMFITNRLLNIFGVGIVNIFYPVFVVGSYISFFVASKFPTFTMLKLDSFPGGLPPNFIAAAFGRFVKVPLNKALYRDVTNLLYNAVPHTLRGRSMAFITGVMLPIGSVFAGFFILVAKKFNIETNYILYVGVGISLITLYISFIQRKQYVDSLINLLKGRNVNLEAVQTGEVAQISINELNRMVEMLQQEDDEEMNIFTVEVLGQVGKKRVVEPLLEIMDKKSNRVRDAIVRVLGNIGDSSVLSMITKYLDSPVHYLRLSSVEAVWKLGSSQQIAQYLSKMTNDSSYNIRSTVLCLLAKNPDKKISEEAVSQLDQMLESDDIKMKIAAIEGIGKVRVYSYRDRLTQFFDIENSIVKAASIRAFESLIGETDKQYLPVILKLLKDKDRIVRREASELLIKVHDLSALEELVEALNDISPKVRSNAVKAIVKIGKPAERLLIELLKDVTVPIRIKEQAVIALHELGSSKIKGFLLVFAQTELKHAYHNISKIAVLEELENQRAVELLIKALQDRNEEVKSITLKILEVLGDAEVLRLVERTLKRRDMDSRTKANALETLGNVGEKELIKLMLPLYDDISDQDRANFAEEKWEMKRLDVSQILYYSLSSADSWIKACAIFAIGELGKNNFSPYLRKALKDDDPYVQEAAEEALKKLEQGYNRFNIKKTA